MLWWEPNSQHTSFHFEGIKSPKSAQGASLHLTNLIFQSNVSILNMYIYSAHALATRLLFFSFHGSILRTSTFWISHQVPTWPGPLRRRRLTVGVIPSGRELAGAGDVLPLPQVHLVEVGPALALLLLYALEQLGELGEAGIVLLLWNDQRTVL
jgi:hypothetical protein